jgi:hypothetical protein
MKEFLQGRRLKMPVENFKVGEMLNKRTPNTKTWINFDGSYTTEIYQGLVHYQDASGNLHNINTDLFDEADFDEIDFPVAKDGDSLFYEQKEKATKDKKKNRLNRENYDFQGLKVPYEVKIPRNIRRGYSIGKGASKLKLIPVNASVSKGYVEGNKITYPDVWNDADLVLELLPEGIKETIILKTDRAPINFTFEVQGNLTDELKIQPMWLQDSGGTRRDVLQGASEVDGIVYLDIAADTSGLVYPIEIDPTVTLTATSSWHDVYVAKSNPNGNFNYSGQLKVGSAGDYTTLIKPDVSSMPSEVIITDAKLNLYVENVPVSGLTYSISEISTNWSEVTVTSNTKPTFINTENFQANPVVGQYLPFTITSRIVNQLAGSNYGIAIEYGGTHLTDFGSRNHAQGKVPTLTITYNQPPTAPVVTAPNGGETWNSLHTVAWLAANDSELKTFRTNTQTSGLASHGTAPGGPIGQSFTTVENGYLTKISMYVNNTHSSGVSEDLSLSLVGVTNDLPNGTIYAQKFVPIAKGYSGFVDFILDNPLYFPAGSKLGVQIDAPTGHVSYASIVGATSDNYSGGKLYYSGAVRALDANIIVEYDLGTIRSLLKYQIQLSTDNGATWKDIVTLTAAGVTSYPYDFINEAETSTALIRIRAYDGSAYGPWDVSDGVFTIVHNQAPTAPTGLSTSGIAKDRASVIRYGWLHNDPNSGDPQSKFDLQWRLQGAGTWNTVTQTTTNNYYDMPAGTLPKGTIEWQVRTYDQAGLPSPYSALQVFVAGDKPATPIFVSPADGSTVAVSKPVVQWSSDGQTGYEVKVLDATGVNTLWTTGQVDSTNKAVTVGMDLENETDYQIQVLIKNSDGLWSTAAVSNIHVSYTPPALPVLSTSVNDSAGKITINIDNPTPQGTEPDVSFNDLYRRESGSTVWERIATNLSNNGSYTDYTAASEQVYEYRVIVQGSNETIRESMPVSAQVKLRGIYLHVVNRALETSKRFFIGEEKNSSVWNLNHTFHKFAGRKNLVIDTEDSTEYGVSFTLKIWEDDERKALEKIVYSQEVVCFRDGRGRKMFGVFVTFPLEDAFWGESTSLNLTRIDYKEEI